MTEHGMFVNVQVGPGCTHGSGCRLCIDACPVDIFAAAPATGPVLVRAGQEDECILCDLCVARCPPGALRIVRLYDPAPG